MYAAEASQAEFKHHSPVIFATRAIKTGTKITSEMIDKKMMANPCIPAKTLWDKDLAVGMTARLDIKKVSYRITNSLPDGARLIGDRSAP